MSACKGILDGGGTNSFWDSPASLNVAAPGGNPLHPPYEGAIGLWVQAALDDLIASACEFRVARFVWPIRDQSPSKTGLHARHALLERFEHGCHDAGDGNAHEPQDSEEYRVRPARPIDSDCRELVSDCRCDEPTAHHHSA